MLLSYHGLMDFVSDLTCPRACKVKRTGRKLTGNQSDDIKSCLNQKPFTSLTDLSVNDLMNDYGVTMTGVFNTLAPEKINVYYDTPRALWFCDEILEHRKKVRKLERRYKTNTFDNALTNGSSVPKDEHNRLIDDPRSSYNRSRIENSDQQKLAVIDDMIADMSALAKTFPSYDDQMTLANMFSEFICDNVAKFRKRLDESNIECTLIELGHFFSNHPFTSFSFELDVS